MNMIRRWLSFPLLAKELTERAARDRTYWVRVLFAIGVFLFFAAIFQETTYRRGTNAVALFGVGSELLNHLFMLQLGGIYLFQPALIAGSIAHEKERDSFSALLLTNMSPWAIAFQKFIGGLLPMLNLLLITLPLCGLAYTYGGISSTQLVIGTWLILGAWLQIGAIGLMCSAYCRTTTGALISTYVIAAGSFFLSAFFENAPSPLGEMSIAYFPIRIFGQLKHASVAGSEYDLSTLLHKSIWDFHIPISTPALSAVVFFLIARFFVVRRAFVPNRPTIVTIFLRLDRIFSKWNRSFGNIQFGRNVRALPTDQPVAWREFGRSALGYPEHLIRLGAGLSVIAWLASFATGMAVGFFALGGLLIIVVRAANSISSERMDQTLEVLLTTPVTAHEIVCQKWLAVRRLAWVLAAPVLVAIASRLLLASSFIDASGYSLFVVLVSWTLAMIVCPYTFGWMAMLIGVRSRSRLRAVVLSLVLTFGWLFGPQIFSAIFLKGELADVFQILSPAFTLSDASEFFSGDGNRPHFSGGMSPASFVILLLLGKLFRRMAIRSAETHLAS